MNDNAEARMPLVTVIIPSYNHAIFLNECIDSVLLQDYPAIEVVVVDDGSTDGSLEILRAYGNKILLIEQCGGRQARARNLALAVARGEYVAFLDSDDRYRSGRIRCAVEVFLNNSAIDVVWSDYRTVNAAGQVLDLYKWAPKDEDFRKELISSNPICNATVTVRRNLLDGIGGFDERGPMVCDGAAWYQIAASGHKFFHLNEPLIDYRIHRNNDSRRFAAMAGERDTALISAGQAYLRSGIVSTVQDKIWLRAICRKQFAFRAAAWVQRDISSSIWSNLLVWFYRGLGSDMSLRIFSLLRAIKHAVWRRSRV